MREQTRHRRALLRAAEHGDATNLKSMLSSATKAHLGEALVLACSRHHTIPLTPGHTAVVKLLLKAGADPDTRGGWGYDRPITAAASAGFKQATQLLLKAGAKKDIYAMAALGDAAGVARALRKSRTLATTADDAGLLALHHCANSRLGHGDSKTAKALAKVAQLLLGQGAPVNTRGKPPSIQRIRPALTPLIYACIAGNESVAKVLLAHGANPNEHSSWGTPLMQACKYCPALANVLVAYGAELDEPLGHDGQTALHVMAHFPHPAAVEWLLEHGADPQVKAKDGRTPLHWAAQRNGGPKVAEMLLDAGADINARDEEGLTPLAYAEANHKTRVAEFLKQHGAKR